MERPVIELIGLGSATLEGSLAKTLSKLIGGGVSVRKGDYLLRGSGGADVVEKLVDEKMGLSGTGTGAHVDNLGIAQNSVLLLIVEPFKLVGTGTTDKLHSGVVREDLGGQVDEAYDHAVVDQICFLVHSGIVVNYIVELVLQCKCCLGNLVVLVPLIELL